jgi:FMN phosphatase YigB (HAD superfamily)
MKLLTFEKEFFTTIMNDLNAAPSDCFYIERHPENTNAARSVGINIISYTNPSNVWRSLRGYGLL